MATPLRNQLGKRIAPGIWLDAAGDPHWSITELLELLELDDTPKNRDRVMAIVRDVVRSVNPQALIIERETPED